MILEVAFFMADETTEKAEKPIDRFEYEYGILKDIEDYRAGRLETYSIDEVRAHCGLAN